jgi:hypothetical protein
MESFEVQMVLGWLMLRLLVQGVMLMLVLGLIMREMRMDANRDSYVPGNAAVADATAAAGALTGADTAAAPEDPVGNTPEKERSGVAAAAAGAGIGGVGSP